MGFLFFSPKFSSFCILSVLGTFSLNCLSGSLYSHEVINFSKRDVKIDEHLFLENLNKLISDLYNSLTVEDLFKNVINIKQETECYYNITISIREAINQLNLDFISEEYLETFINELETLENSEIDFFYRSSVKQKDSGAALPLRFSFGVSVALAGLFVYMTCPVFPPSKVIGKKMMQFGTGLALEGYFNHAENQKT